MISDITINGIFGKKWPLIACILSLEFNLVHAQTIYFSEEQLRSMDETVLSQKNDVKPYLEELQKFADLYMKSGPWSVTYHSGKAASGDPHDYYSESPYWWPDPDDPEAPFIRKDGFRNPERFTDHKESLAEMTIAVSILSIAGHYLQKAGYSRRAVEILRIWFIDDSTRMNPHLEYAQAIPNTSSGRSVGIIDTHNWTKWFDALYLLSLSGLWANHEQDKLRRWFSDYLEWMLNSEKGQEEKMRSNNHATWWTAQTAALSSFTGRRDLLPMLEDHTKNFLIRNQIEGSGRCPEEEARTRSYDYVLFNLEAFGFLCRFFERHNIYLWEWENNRGGSIKKALDYMIPYIEHPQLWKGEQVTKIYRRDPAILVFTGMHYPDAGYLDIYKQQMTERVPGSRESRYDPFRLWLNLWVSAQMN